MRKLTALSAALVLVGGCALNPQEQANRPELPEHWPGNAVLGPGTEQWQQWWTRFEDPHLDRLVERALGDNLNLQAQLQRIEQARAELGLRRAERWPSLSAQAEASRERTAATVSQTGQSHTDERYSVAGVLNYELDLWGRLAREREAAAAQLASTVYGTEAVRLNLITEVVTTYFNLRSAQRQRAITRQTLASRERSLELEQLRHDSGASDPLAVRQARAELESTRARLPQLEQQTHELGSALAILVGYSPRELLDELDFGEGQLSDLTLPDRMPEVLPSELLQRRPDIRAAGARFEAASAQLGAARAQRFPSLNLNLLGGSVALAGGDLFTAPAEMWSATAALAGPLLDFGRTRAGIDSAEARRARAEAEYQLAITNAFKDARDALVLYRTAEQRVTAVRRQTRAIEETVELAELQYEAGRIGFYELLDARRRLLEAELALSRAVSERLAASATLFKAMGGGWQADSAEQTAGSS